MSKNSENPKSKAKKLIEPMVFSDRENGAPLFSPMEFFDQPLKNGRIPKQTEEDSICSESKEEYQQRLLREGEAYRKKHSLPHLCAEIVTSAKAAAPKVKIVPNFVERATVSEKVMPLPKLPYDLSAMRSNGEKVPSVQPFVFAREFLKTHPMRILRERFYIFSKTHYAQIEPIELSREVFDTFRSVLMTDSYTKPDAIVACIKREKKICASDQAISNYIVSFENCMIDLIKWQSFSHNPNVFVTYSVKANYRWEQDLPSPRFDQYLWDISGGDTNLITRVWEMIGYILTPDTAAKKYFLLQGVGDSGKSLLCNLITELFSDDAIAHLDAHDFGSRFSLASIVGKAICFAPDMSAKSIDSNSASKIKQLTGNDTVTTDVKFGSNVSFQTRAKFIFATNHAFLTFKNDEAFYNRCICVPFRYTVPPEKKDENLLDKILTERDFIVTKAILHYRNLVSNHYQFSGNYRPNEIFSCADGMESDEQSLIFSFVHESFVADPKGCVFVSDAIELFKRRFGNIAFQSFSTLFIKYTSEHFGATHKRKRKPGQDNPISCMAGISFKETGDR